MSIDLTPEVSNMIFYAFLVISLGGGLVAAAVLFSAWFKRLL